MFALQLRFLFLLCFCVCVYASPIHSQTLREQTLSGPDRHEMPEDQRKHLFGEWGGVRTRLRERGVNIDLQYVSDSLWNINSDSRKRFAMWNRVRGTVNIDLGLLAHKQGWYFHATGLWQAGGNLSAHLGLITGASGMASQPTFRLDSWWFEKRWKEERIVVRAGQFAGQDFYGTQHYGASFIFEPMGYALGNLFSTFEVFDPPSTPAAEIRIVPRHDLYVKSMVMSGDPAPFSHNPSGFVPQFHGHAVIVWEIGFTPGKKASSIRAFDNVESRKGYSGLYQFGGSYNPGKFTVSNSASPRSGNYLLYGMATQALWRAHPKKAKGLDGTIAYDWSPPNANRNNTVLTAGLRFNEPLPLHIHNTMSLGYVGNRVSPEFLHAGLPHFKTEHGTEFNVLLVVGPLLIQPVIQYYANVGGNSGHALVSGFRTKVDF